MIRLSASLSRKVPLPDVAFSSQQYGASMEIEISDADTPEAIKGRIRELYALLSASIDEQLAQAQAPANSPQPVDPHQSRTPCIPAANGNGRASRAVRSNGREVKATAAQVRAVKAIAAEQGIDLGAVLAPYKVAGVEALSIRTASQLIDDLKARKANGNRH